MNIKTDILEQCIQTTTYNTTRKNTEETQTNGQTWKGRGEAKKRQIHLETWRFEDKVS
jgi:hypothetical protein